VSAGGWQDSAGPQDGAVPAGSETLRGLRRQARVVHALLLREMQTRFGRNQLGFLWLFLEPLLLAGAIAVMKWLAGMGEIHPGVSVFVFALAGYLPYFTFRAIICRAPGTLNSNMTLLYHSSIKLIDVVLARHLLEMAAILTVMALIVVGFSIWADLQANSIPTLFVGLLLLFAFANGLGLIAAAAAAASEMADRLIHPLVYLSLPISGALVSLHSLPPWMRELYLLNPQANIHEMVREGFFGHLVPSYYDVGYVLFWVAMVNLLGLAGLRAVRPTLRF
jgi:capsular polysaccharide transport system permease protein